MLPFPALPELQPSIFWDDNPPLHYLHELPRGALSGPIQEYKARAHGLLVRVVDRQQVHLPAIDLRRVDGLCSVNPLDGPCPSFETYAATPHCRAIRIISFKDFTRTLNEALPGFKGGPTVTLLQASWQGERLFWTGEQHSEAFACAIAYARLRGLDISVPCHLVQYRIDPAGLAALEQAFHVLLMPEAAWSDRDFMRHLLESGVPYARLRLKRHALEMLLLDRQDPLADALGRGLVQAGASDFTAYLHRLV